MRAGLVDQHHAALAHALGEQKIVLGAGNHVDDGIADTENVVAGCGHWSSYHGSGYMADAKGRAL